MTRNIKNELTFCNEMQIAMAHSLICFATSFHYALLEISRHFSRHFSKHKAVALNYD